MDEEPEMEKSTEEDKKHNDISMFPAPFLYGEDEFPADFSHEYGKIDSASHWHINSQYNVDHDMNAMIDHDTTLYDVRNQVMSPTTPGKLSVKFAADVENIDGNFFIYYFCYITQILTKLDRR